MNEIRDEIINILQSLHEDIDFEKQEKLVDEKILDSFDLVSLVAEFGEIFDVKILAKDFIPENFNSVDSLTALIERLLDE